MKRNRPVTWMAATRWGHREARWATTRSRTSCLVRVLPGRARCSANYLPLRLAGYVYEDLNESTTQDTGEAGIAGVSVRLSGIDDLGQTVDQTETTASDGTFAFGNLRPGTYSLTETQPTTPFYFDGLDTAGSLGGWPAMT